MTQSNDEEKELVIRAAIEGIGEMARRREMKRTSKQGAKIDCGDHSQSVKRIAYDAIVSDLLSGKQELPVRPRDFRLKLDDREQEKIGRAELSDNLKSLVRVGMLDNRRNNFSFSRGHQPSYLASERRGRQDSYYERSEASEKNR